MRLALILILCAGTVGAQPPEKSLRPMVRAAAITEPVVERIAERVTEPAVNAERAKRPVRQRLQGGRDAASGRPAGARSLRPAPRSQRVVERAVAVRRDRQRGAVCGNQDIQGSPVGRIRGRVTGCGVKDAVRVRSVSGVALTQKAVMDCQTADALNRWVASSAKPALSGINGGLARLKVAAHYICRTRNHKSGARISEHGKGRAIDISGFHMRDGSIITVENGWTAAGTNQALRKMHRGACGTFGTVLGPEADSYHTDHFHFDTARYRSGSYCR